MVSAYKSFEGVYHMSIFRTIIAVCLFSAAAFAQDDVNLSAPAFLDDFNDAYGGAPHQNTLGEVYGCVTEGAAYLGGGYWYTFDDKSGSTVKNAAGERIVAKNNEITMVPDSFMHVLISTSTSSLDYPYAAVGCNLVGEGEKYLDFSKMTAVKLKVKGSGTVRMQFDTKDFADGGYDWGQYGYSIKLTADWTTVNIPVDDLLPEAYSEMDKAGWTWSHGASAVNKMAFQVKSGDADFSVDDIELVGLTYGDLFSSSSVNRAKSFRVATVFSVNPSTISFNLPQKQSVTLSIHDMLGNKVRSLYNGTTSAKTINWNSSSLPNGRYLVVLDSKEGRLSQPLNITK